MQTRPEAKGDAGHDAAAGYALALLQTLHCDDHLLDAFGLEQAEVHQPGVFERILWLPLTEDVIDGIAEKNLKVVNHAEARSCNLGMPLIHCDGALKIAIAGL